MLEKLRRRLGLPARLGYPVNIVPLGDPLCRPSNSTALGLLRYCNDVHNNGFQSLVFGGQPKGWFSRFVRWTVGKMS
jgi:hypothetical protein